MDSKVRGILLLLLLAALVGCGSEAAPTDPFTVVGGALRVRLEVEPMPPRAGQEATFIFLVEDAQAGEPVENVTLRPVVDMSMPDMMRMSVPLGELQQAAPGEFRAEAFIEHEGTLRVTANLVEGALVTPVRFPEISIAPWWLIQLIA
jgi:hypothetical protein